MTPSPTVHATCVAVGAAGVLIRGAPGAGKSSLALALTDAALRDGSHAALVADDRVRLAAVGGRLLATCPDALAGLIEIHGAGVREAPYLPNVIVRLLVNMEPFPARMPDDGASFDTVEGVRLPRLAVAERSPLAPALVRQTLAENGHASDCGASALAFAPQHGKVRSPARFAPWF
ncbi:HPr kinase/phosphorylase [Methylopila musalis]|uniref:HPr kinase/phosphorylase n=1 Tax=Methylopila musalis TaxID=1134781 RepID=A0ABW3Z8H2_9HYPH